MYYKGDGNFITDQPVRAVQEGLIGRYGTLDPSDGNASERLSVSGHYAWERGDWSFAVQRLLRAQPPDPLERLHPLPGRSPSTATRNSRTKAVTSPAARRPIKLKSSFAGIDTQTTVGVQGRYDDLYVDRRHTKRPGRSGLLRASQSQTGPPRRYRSAFPTVRPAASNSAMSAFTYRKQLPGGRAGCEPTLGLRYEYYAGQDHSLLPGTVFSNDPLQQGGGRCCSPRAA